MIPVKLIAQGFINDFLDGHNLLDAKTKAEAERRISICVECKLYNPKNGRCDENLSSNETGKLIEGCGCYMAKKTKVPEAECVQNKW
jgi:hypothetical protein